MTEVITEPRVLSFTLSPKHPDWVAVSNFAHQSNRAYNALNRVRREHQANYEYKKKHGLDKEAALAHLLSNETLIDMGVTDALREMAASKHGLNLSSPFALDKILQTVYRSQEIALPVKAGQLVGKKVQDAWSGYFASRKSYFADPSRFTGGPKMPGYRHGNALVEYNSQAISKTALRRGWVLPSGWKRGFKLPKKIDPNTIQSARLVFKSAKIAKLEVIYNKTIKYVTGPDAMETPVKHGKRQVLAGRVPLAAAIDLGVNILAAVAFSDGRAPLLVNGKPLKSMNQYANKKNAELRSKYDREREDIYTKACVQDMLHNPQFFSSEYVALEKPFPFKTHALARLWEKRNKRIDHYLHTASNAIVRELRDAGVKQLVVNFNAGQKQNSNMGKVNNQNFVQIPLGRFKDMLLSKAREAGIRAWALEESYASKSSLFDDDPLPVFNKKNKIRHVFSGKRVKRGLYKSADGTLIHADVHGAYNGLRKHVIPDLRLLLERGSNGRVVRPEWLSLKGYHPSQNKAAQTKVIPVPVTPDKT